MLGNQRMNGGGCSCTRRSRAEGADEGAGGTIAVMVRIGHDHDLVAVAAATMIIGILADGAAADFLRADDVGRAIAHGAVTIFGSMGCRSRSKGERGKGKDGDGFHDDVVFQMSGFQF